MILGGGPLLAQSRLPSSRRQAAQARYQEPPAGPIEQPLPPPQPPETVPSGPPARDVTGKTLTLHDLECMALVNNPTLVQAMSHIRAAQGQRLQAGLLPNPIVGYQTSEAGNNGTPGQQGAFWTQEFVRRKKLNWGRAEGSQAVAVAQRDFAAQRLRVLNDVRTEYFNVLVAEQAMELTAELASINRRALQATEDLFRNEQVAYVDVLQVTIEVDSAQIAVENAGNRYGAAWRRLASVVGVPDMPPHPLEGDLTAPAQPLQWEASLARLLSQSPELASARAEAARARAAVEKARVEPAPNVVAQLGLQYDYSSRYTIGNVQVGVPVPLLDRNQGNVQTAFADLRNAQAEIGRVELSLRSRLASAFETYSNARHQVDKYERHILPHARTALDAIAKGYKEQQFSFLSLLNAQRTFAQASLAHLQALQQLTVSRVAIEGLMLTGSLREEHEISVPKVDTGIAPVFGPGRPPVEIR